MSEPTTRIPWLGVLAFVLLLATTYFLFFGGSKTEPATRYHAQKIDRPAPELKLTDHHGRPFSLDQLRGKLVLISFGFTSCPNICPTTLGNLASAYRGLTDAEKRRVQVVFVTVDPERDTVAKLAEYVPFFHSSFLGLTGTASEIARAAKGFGVFYAKEFLAGSDARNSYTINHSSNTFLIAPDGKWLLLYDYDGTGHPDAVREDVQKILAKQPAK